MRMPRAGKEVGKDLNGNELDKFLGYAELLPLLGLTSEIKVSLP